SSCTQGTAVLSRDLPNLSPPALHCSFPFTLQGTSFFLKSTASPFHGQLGRSCKKPQEPPSAGRQPLQPQGAAFSSLIGVIAQKKICILLIYIFKEEKKLSPVFIEQLDQHLQI
uniref:Uncharacterized protein n=1 Tax=Zonotrichia albicollis TaxID=44394 RepID=A0A8D2N793_ZONAL